MALIDILADGLEKNEILDGTHWRQLLMRDETRIEAIGPSPFTHELAVEISLARGGEVLLALYDPLGREVGRLIDGSRDEGSIAVRWRPEELEAGVYFLDLRIDGRRIASRQVHHYR